MKQSAKPRVSEKNNVDEIGTTESMILYIHQGMSDENHDHAHSITCGGFQDRYDTIVHVNWCSGRHCSITSSKTFYVHLKVAFDETAHPEKIPHKK